MKYLYNPPFIVKKILNDFFWQTSNNKIFLTFDDGPNPETTENILSTLNNQKIKALFFCVGENVNRYKELTKTIIDEGHTIGNHTYHHKKLPTLPKAKALEEINNFTKLMKENFDYNVIYFRPPHGRINLVTKRLIKETEMKCVMWNLLTYDYKNDIKKVKFAVNKYLKKNSLVVLHDSLKSKDIIENSINFIAETAEKKCFEFGSVDECLN